MRRHLYRGARLAVAALALFALEGCLMFERPPAALSCDPALVGHWVPVPGSEDAAVPMKAEDFADTDAKCRVHLSTASGGGKAEFDALGFQHDGQRYLALDRADLDGLFAVGPSQQDDKLPETAVFLVKYRIDGDLLEISLPDMPYVIQEFEAKRFPAREVDSSVYLVRGGEKKLRKILSSQPALFKARGDTGTSLRLRRDTAEKRS